MKLIKPSFEIIEQQYTCNKMDATAVQKREWLLNGIYKQIELAGRTCYKSEDKITEDSAKGFVERMIKSGHGAMLEHGTVYLKICWEYPMDTIYDKYKENKYSKVCRVLDSESLCPIWYVTTNLRVLVENDWMDDLKYLCEPTEYHEKRVTVRFILPIGISREFCRHRVFSFAEQSTRYCNFSSDKFNNELTFIEDQWCDKELLRQIEYWYINSYLKPQEKRNLLPLCTKTELVMTGFVSDWKHFFFLRCPINAHPQARELAIPLREEFINKGYVKSEDIS